MENIYIVICNGISDIGKGWLTAAITGLDPKNTLPIKIDPLLNISFPQHLGIAIDDLCDADVVRDFIDQGYAPNGQFKISEDMGTYKAAGATIYPECNIVAGGLIKRFLESDNVEIRPGEIKKRTFADLSRFLATEITTIAKKYNPKTVVIEVGGTIEDQEMIYIPSTFRFLGTDDFLGIKPKIVFLTYFEYAESYEPGKYRVKTQHIRRGLKTISQRYYELPLKACFVRRRNIPQNEAKDEQLKRDLRNVAYETQLSENRIVLLPDVNSGSLTANLNAITEFLRSTKLFTS